MIETWSAWLEASALARALRASIWAYPLVNAAHILGIALLMGAIVVFDLRLLGWRRNVPMSALVPVLLPVARSGFVLAASTGTLLFVARASDYVASPVFRLKLALLLLALINVGWLHRSGWWRDYLSKGGADSRLLVAAVGSLTSWLGVLIAGRMIGYR